MKRTKTEEALLARVAMNNRVGALSGLATSPKDASWSDAKHRFIRRLYEAGLLLWVPWTAALGAGWAVPEFKDRFLLVCRNCNHNLHGLKCYCGCQSFDPTGVSQ